VYTRQQQTAEPAPSAANAASAAPGLSPPLTPPSYGSPLISPQARAGLSRYSDSC
jgi:hypothetical protein